MELYNNIRKYRIERGLTKDQLSKLTGYTDRSSIAKIEKGLVDISQSKLELFAAVLKVSPGELMGKVGSSDHFAPSADLTGSERELLGYFRQLNDAGQIAALDVIRGLVSGGGFKKTVVENSVG